MFTVTFKNYRNDYDKYLETKNFASLEDLTKVVGASKASAIQKFFTEE